MILVIWRNLKDPEIFLILTIETHKILRFPIKELIKKVVAY
jgi:hypothetical protein